MEEKIYKYNSACEADKHTDKPYQFTLHVAHCKICQEKLPAEILDSLEPRLGKMKAKIAVAEARTKEIEKPKQPVDDLDDRISESPVIKRLADGIEKINQSLAMLGLGAGDTGKEVDTPGQGKVQAGESEAVAGKEEMKREARDINKDLGVDVEPAKKEQGSPVSKAVGYELKTPEEIAAFEQYLSEQKQRMGMEGEAPASAPSEGKDKIGSAIDLVITKVVDYVLKGKGGGGVPTSSKMMEGLVTQLIGGLLAKKDSTDVLLEGIKIGAGVGGNQKDPMEYWTDGAKSNTMMLGNALKILSGKGSIIPSGPSVEDIDKRIEQKLGEILTPKKEEESLT